jgi:hypothetical protein
LTDVITSPGCSPAARAPPSSVTPPTSAPLIVESPAARASAGRTSLMLTPRMARRTRPYLRNCSIAVRAIPTGTAKP